MRPVHEHGTIAVYSKGCRCPECRQAKAAYAASQRRRIPPNSVSTRARPTPSLWRCTECGFLNDQRPANLLARRSCHHQPPWDA